MKKIFWILSAFIVVAGIIILAIALTNNSPENPFKDYRLIIGIGFLAITGLIRIGYKRLYS